MTCAAALQIFWLQDRSWAHFVRVCSLIRNEKKQEKYMAELNYLLYTLKRCSRQMKSLF